MIHSPHVSPIPSRKTSTLVASPQTSPIFPRKLLVTPPDDSSVVDAATHDDKHVTFTESPPPGQTSFLEQPERKSSLKSFEKKSFLELQEKKSSWDLPEQKSFLEPPERKSSLESQKSSPEPPEQKSSSEPPKQKSFLEPPEKKITVKSHEQQVASPQASPIPTRKYMPPKKLHNTGKLALLRQKFENNESDKGTFDAAKKPIRKLW